MNDLPRCHSCNAPISARATVCALCDVALTPVVTSSGARPSYVPPPSDPLAGHEEIRPLWGELTKTLAPHIRLVGVLGEGGMGLVFIGVDDTLRRDVAIKVLRPAVADDSVARARFRREAEAAAAVAHPNIVSVFQVGELPRSRIPYIVMQYVDGPTLGDAIGRALPEARVRRIMAEIASALAAAHRRNVVHRDVKPPNIALDGETGRALVLDFGISAALSQRRQSGSIKITTGGMYLGTPTYMSPEQASADQVTPKSDVYSLGVLAYELLTGKPPFEGNAQQIMAAHVRDKPPRLLDRRQDITPELVSLVERCLEKNPADRPAAQEIVNYLQPSSHALIEWPPPGTARLRRAGAQLLGVALMLAAATLAFFGILAMQPQLITASTDPPATADSGIPPIGAATATGVAAVRQHAAESAAVWSFLLGAGVVVLALLTLALVYRAWTTISLARWARAAGYPWSVVFATATDQHRDTSDLRNTTGRFAVLNPAERDLIRRFRRGKALASILSLPAAVFAMIFWISGLPAGLAAHTETLLPVRDALLVTAPIVVCLLGALLLLLLEQLFFRRTLGTFRIRVATRPAIKPELVQSWLTASGDSAVHAPGRLPSRGVFVAVLVALGAATALPAAAILTVVGETTARLIPARAAAAEWVDGLRTDSLRPMAWREVDALMAASAIRLVPSLPGDPNGVIRGFVAGFIEVAHRAADSAWIVEPGEVSQLPTESALHAPSLEDAARELRTSTSAATLARLGVDTTSPRLGPFRAIAHVPTLSDLWGYRPGIPHVGSPFEIPVFRPTTIRRVGNNNALSGLLALGRGDTVTALLRARENVAVARQLTRQLDDQDAATAALLVLQASQVIHSISEAKGSPVHAAEADHLERVADELRRPVRLRYGAKALGLFADPANSSGVQLFGDSTLAPSSRVVLILPAIFGHCLNAREVLFGIDPRRQALLDSASVRLRDIPRADEIVSTGRRWLARWVRDQRGVAAENVNSILRLRNQSRLIKSLGWIGLGGVRDRMLVCRDLPL
jgi:hypothetical protein